MEILGLEKVSLVDYGGYVCATIFTGGCNFMCPFCHNASLVKRNATTIEEKEVLEYLKSRTKLLDAVTISGGEPTLQKDLKLFIKKVKEIGYKVKLDTNGTNPTVLKELLEENPEITNVEIIEKAQKLGLSNITEEEMLGIEEEKGQE